MQSEASSIYLLKTALTKYEVIPAKRKVSSSIQRKNLGFDLLKRGGVIQNSDQAITEIFRFVKILRTKI